MPVTIRTESGKTVELLNREIIGSRVRCTYPLMTSQMEVPANTEMEVREVRAKDGTLYLSGVKCPHCGITATVMGVQPRECTLSAASMQKIEAAREEERARRKARAEANRARKAARTEAGEK